MFVNFTNHPSINWEKEQLEAALHYGKIVDIPFPNVSPVASPEEIKKEAENQIARIEKHNPEYVLCQGEFCMAYQVIKGLKERGIRVGAACSERRTIEKRGAEGIEKNVLFHFVQFREY